MGYSKGNYSLPSQLLGSTDPRIAFLVPDSVAQQLFSGYATSKTGSYSYTTSIFMTSICMR